MLVLILLSVAACVVGFSRGSADRCQDGESAADCKNRQGNMLSGDAITGLLKGLAPEPPPVLLQDIVADCGSGSFTPPQLLHVPSSCALTLSARSDPRRQLQLAGSSFHVDVSQTSGGKTVNSGTDVPVDTQHSVTVVLNRDDSALIALSCFGGCDIALNPPH